ncbi:MAG: helix-turn-helix domain-containing protein [Microthrixaceae bacterium]|jgi:hypothetical protein|nr:helix-turn-helix domain-containing protein [Microthrixaceae bacterium]
MTTPDTVSTDLTFALVPEWLLDAEVSAQAIRLYAVLSRYADRDGNAYPSRRALAERLRVKSKDTVDRALKELTDLRAITVRGRVDDAGDQTSNHYVVHRVPPPAVAANTRPPHQTDAATPPDGCGDGGRTDAATVAAQIVHEREPLEREPLERRKNLEPADAASTSSALTLVDDDSSSREDVERLCIRLADAIAANGSKRPTITKAWRDAARRLIDLDGRTETQIAAAIDWCQDDEFWRTNVLSMPTLRKQYDRLRLAAQRAQNTPRRRGDIDWDATFARAAERDARNQNGIAQ